MACRARVVSTAVGGRFRAVTADLPVGNGPQQYRSAYGLPGSGGHGRTVAIVDALGYPEAARDLAAYRAAAGLPACPVATGCLRITDQRGGSHLPPADDGWALEQALDLDVASAIPDCSLLLVQAGRARRRRPGRGPADRGPPGRLRDQRQLRPAGDR